MSSWFCDWLNNRHGDNLVLQLVVFSHILVVQLDKQQTQTYVDHLRSQKNVKKKVCWEYAVEPFSET